MGLVGLRVQLWSKLVLPNLTDLELLTIAPGLNQRDQVTLVLLESFHLPVKPGGVHEAHSLWMG